MDRIIRILLILSMIVALLLAGMATVYFLGRTPAAAPVATPVPEEAQPRDAALFRIYDGTLMHADGREAHLREWRGRPVVLLFWSSWCPDCKAYLEGAAASAFAAARERGAEVRLVCREGRRGETWETALDGLAELSLKEETLMDPDSTLYESMGLRSVPSLAVLDADGRLVIATTHMPDAREMQEMLDVAQQGHLARSDAFFRQSLIGAEGAVPSAYHAQGGQVQWGEDVLSETQGLMMLYALHADDQALFDRLLGYVRTRMTVAGLTAWQVSGGEKAAVNASLDDLRILEALSLAETRWGGYAQELGYRESALWRRAVKQGHLRDYAALSLGGEDTKTVTLCYLDVAAMEELAKRWGRWQSAADNARQVLENGVISPEFPLYHPRYEPESGAYSGDRLQMNEALVTVLNAARAGMDVTPALDWLEVQLESGAIYAMYDLQGHPVRGYLYESTATYALLAQAAMHAGREDLARMALARMERKRCFTEPLAGDMGSVNDPKHYTFDIVQAMLAWQQWNERSR